jgi:hypothetical protein
MPLVVITGYGDPIVSQSRTMSFGRTGSNVSARDRFVPRVDVEAEPALTFGERVTFVAVSDYLWPIVMRPCHSEHVFDIT